MQELKHRLQAGIKPFSIHLLSSACVVALVACVIFLFWYPYPYYNLMGGMHLFLLMAAVDVICGPVMTFVLFDQKKSKKEFYFDFTIIICVQIFALAYGCYTMAMVRPVALVFEVDRMVAVSAIQVDESTLEQAPPKFRSLSWSGPKIMGVRQPRSAEDQLDKLNGSLQGVEPSARPNWWQAYDNSRDDVRKTMQPIEKLMNRIGADKEKIEKIKKCPAHEKNIFYLPLVSQKSLDGWVVFLNENADVVCYVEVSGFS
jgi:hypothetical protein